MKLLLYFYICIRATLALQNLDLVYEWKYVDYVWESEEQRTSYIQNNQFDVKDVFPVDVEIAKDGRVFITALGKKDKVPALSVVTNLNGPGGPLLQPYPDWSWHTRRDCDAISAVYRIIADECNRLYVLDTGYIGHNASCPAQVLVFDLNTDTLINQFKIPNSIGQNAEGKGMLVTPVVEASGPDCKPSALYLADVYGGGLVIVNEKEMIRLEMKIFKPEKNAGTMRIAGDSVDLDVSMIGITLSPEVVGESRRLYVRPFASRSLYSIDTQDLAQSLVDNNIKYKEGKNMLPSQVVTMATAANGTVFLGLTKEIAIGCWNQYRSMNKNNLEIVAQNSNELQFASGMKVFPETRTPSNAEELWVFTNRFQKVTLNIMNFDEINFRLLKGSVKSLIENTKCEKPAD